MARRVGGREGVRRVLRAALADANKVGIATFLMRGKQYLTALRAEDEVLVLQTLHWADEARDPRQVAVSLSVDVVSTQVRESLRLLPRDRCQ